VFLGNLLYRVWRVADIGVDTDADTGLLDGLGLAGEHAACDCVDRPARGVLEIDDVGENGLAYTQDAESPRARNDAIGRW